MTDANTQALNLPSRLRSAIETGADEAEKRGAADRRDGRARRSGGTRVAR